MEAISLKKITPMAFDIICKGDICSEDQFRVLMNLDNIY